MSFLWISRLLLVSYLIVNARKSGTKSATRRKLQEKRQLDEVKHDCQLTSFRTPMGILDILEEGTNNTLAPYFFHEKKPGVYEVRLMPHDKADMTILLNRLSNHGYASHVIEHEKTSSWQFFQCMIASKIEPGPDVPKLTTGKNLNTEDEIMDQELAILSVLQENLIKRKIKIGDDSINPILFKWMSKNTKLAERWVRIDSSFCCAEPGQWQQRDALRIVNMSTSLTMHYRQATFATELEVMDNGHTRETKSVEWYELFPNHSPNVTTTNVTYSSFRGQDVRIVYLPEKDVYLAIYTLRNPSNLVMPGVSIVVRRPVDDADGEVMFGPSWRVHPPEWPSFSGREKNWSPFVHNNTVLFVKHINPMTVVGIHQMDHILADANNATLLHQDDVFASTYVVSTTPFVNGLDWGHGHLRGGTPAVLIDDKYYLSFFHTQTKLKSSGYNTYFMGAYTFSKQPPFTLLSISRFPIVDKQFYTGPWNTRFSNRKINYVVFPMHFTVGDNKIQLTVGHQDTAGWLVTIELPDLLKSMREVGPAVQTATAA